jgi:hyperosmotically inducible protein
VQDGGTTFLRGAVPDAAAQQRAVVLARDTVGVTQVVDELTLLPAPVIPATPVVVPPATTETTTTTTKTIVKP